MANTDKNIVITPNKGSTNDPQIVFSGANANVGAQNITLYVYPASNGTVSFSGSAGELFSITNDLSNSIFSVNDVSGIPSIDVYANGEIRLAPISGNVGIGNIAPAHKLSVSGTMFVSGNANVGNIGATNGVFTNISGTLTTANQSGITAVGALASLSVSGNANVGNLGTAGLITATGNIDGGNLTTAGLITAIGNIRTSGNLIVSNQANISGNLGVNGVFAVTLSATGNIQASQNLNIIGNANIGNIGTAGLITATGNIQGGNLRTANILSVGGNANVGNLGVTGVFATTLSATGNANTGNIGATNGVFTNISGTLTTAAQNNITSVGTLTSLSVSGNANIGNIGTGLITATGNITGGNVIAALHVGNLSGTGNSNVGNLGATGVFATTLSATGNANVGNIGAINGVFTNISGTLTTAAQNNITSVGTLSTLSVSGNANVGNIGATNGVFTNVSGNGALLTNITGASVTGTVANATYATTAGSAGSATTATSATTAGTVTANSQGNITSVGILTSLSVSGNANTGNLNAAFGYFANDAIINGNLFVNGNLTYLNIDTFAVEDPIIQLQTGANGGALGSNTGKDVGTALNYYDTSAKRAFMGWDTSNAEIAFAANVGITNEVVTFTQLANTRSGNTLTTGVFATTLSATGNANVGNIGATNGVFTNISGTLTTAAQNNITSVGTLTSLSVSGNANIGNIGTGLITATGQIRTSTTLSAVGNANVGNIGATNAVLSGSLTGVTTLSATGNANVGNIGATNGVFTNISGTLTTAAQTNITSLGTLTGLLVNGIAQIGNLATGGIRTRILESGGAVYYQIGNGVADTSAPLRISRYSTTTTTVYVDIANTRVGLGGNVSPNDALAVDGTLYVSSNANIGNIGTGGLITATGNIQGNYFIGNGSQLTGIVASSTTLLANGTSNVAIPTSGGNINFTIGGSASEVVFTSTGANVNGYLSVSGNANIANIGTGGSITATGSINSSSRMSAVGLSTSYGVTTGNSVGAFNAVMGVASSATWLLSGTSNGVFAYGIQAVDAGGVMRFYEGANFMQFGSNNLSVAGTVTGSRLISTVTTGTAPFTVSSTTQVANLNAATAGSATTAGTVTTAAQPNITSVGTLTSLSVSGNTNIGNLVLNSGGFVMKSVQTGISAAGTTQATATALGNAINIVSTVTTTNQGVRLPTAVTGMELKIINLSANTLNVYPATSGIINSLAANATYQMGANARLEFVATSTTQWYTMTGVYA